MSDKLKKFHAILKRSRNIIVLTGAGVSAESGIPTFRGQGGYWRKYRATDVATPEAFQRNPSLVWEFYHYRREVVFKSAPNKAHLALAKFESQCKTDGRNFNVITQNIDGLHQTAGSVNVTELHGSLRKIICTKCKQIAQTDASPICEALRDRGDPNLTEDLPPIPVDLLPKCGACNALARPYIVWFGENLDAEVLDKARGLVEGCDLCLVVGTSSVVYPAAMFAPYAAERGVPVAEFNIAVAPNDAFQFYFEGPCGSTLPKALDVAV